MVPRSRLYLHLNVNQYSEAHGAWMVHCVLWLEDDGALVDFPINEHALDAGLESGRVLLFRLPYITQIVTFCHLGLIGVREEWCKSLDIVVGLLEQLGDGDRVMKASGESQQH